MKLLKVKGLPRLHETPLGTIHLKNNIAVIEADDVDERRFAIKFSPYQGVRVTATDCFDFSHLANVEAYTIYEISQSEWIRSLRSALSKSDATATFMEKGRHYFIPLQDDIVEIVAHEVELIPLDQKS